MPSFRERPGPFGNNIRNFILLLIFLLFPVLFLTIAAAVLLPVVSFVVGGSLIRTVSFILLLLTILIPRCDRFLMLPHLLLQACHVMSELIGIFKALYAQLLYTVRQLVQA